MPEVEICCWCTKEINSDADKFVTIGNATADRPRRIAHLSCHQEREKIFSSEIDGAFVLGAGPNLIISLGERLAKKFR